MADIPRTCTHCGAPLNKWRVPEGSSWDDEFFYVCFNDDCSYYRKGWGWMREQYGHEASYRFAINPNTGGSMMIPVWSDSATREMIVEEDEGGDE